MELDPSRRRLIAILDKVKQKVPTLNVTACEELETFVGVWYTAASNYNNGVPTIAYEELSLSDLIKMNKKREERGEVEDTSKERKRKKILPAQKDAWWELYPLVVDVSDIKHKGDELDILVKEAGSGRKKSVPRTADKETLGHLLKNPKSKKSLEDALRRYKKKGQKVPEELMERVGK